MSVVKSQCYQKKIVILFHTATLGSLVRVGKVLQSFTIRQFHPSGFDINEIPQSKMSKTN